MQLEFFGTDDIVSNLIADQCLCSPAALCFYSTLTFNILCNSDTAMDDLTSASLFTVFHLSDIF